MQLTLRSTTVASPVWCDAAGTAQARTACLTWQSFVCSSLCCCRPVTWFAMRYHSGAWLAGRGSAWRGMPLAGRVAIQAPLPA